MTNYEMALSEIEAYKKAHESLSENLEYANKQTQQYKAERDTLINDIAILRKDINNLKNENKAILSQSNSYFDEWQNEQTTSRGLREQCKEYAQDAKKYLHLTEHIRLKAENNPSVSRYIDLVNYIDKLEGEENDV